MPVWPKSFITFGASVLTARTASRLRQRSRAVEQQERTFRALALKLAATRFWSAAGVERGISYDQFRVRVAPRDHAQLAPAIEQTKRGESDVLWPGRCRLFATTSGTSGGALRHLPVTEDLLAHFRRATVASLFYYTARAGHAGVFRGRHVLLGGSTTLTPLPEAQPHEAYAGELSGIAALNLPAWADKHFYEPGASIAQMADWPARIAAIVARTSACDITLLAGLPNWTLALAETLLERSGGGQKRTLRDLWPNLECFVHAGQPIAPYHDELRARLGANVSFHEVYPATEGFIAAQDVEASAGLRLMTNAGIFFEFLPLVDFDAAREALASKVVPLSEAKPGVDYVLLLTTPGGLCRYAIGDVVRFTSLEPPRLVYVGRTKLRLNVFGEQVAEKDLTDALTAVCRRHKWSPVNFHVAPMFLSDLTGQNRGRHEWWIELRPGTVSTPTGPQMAAELDAELQRSGPHYQSRRKAGALEAPYVRLVMPGVFEHWLRFHHKWGGQHRMPRCRGDRLIADELAQVTNFARD
jgi:hypothetical protein